MGELYYRRTKTNVTEFENVEHIEALAI